MLRFSILVLLFIAPSLSFASNEHESKITDVTVYNDRAKVVRTLDTSVSRGSNVIEFSGLPSGIIPDSIRVSGQSERASVVIGAISTEIKDSKDLISQKEKELTDKLEVLGDKSALVDAEIEGLTTRLEFLKNLGKQAVLRSNEEIAALELDPDNWTNAAKALQIQTQEVLSEILTVKIKKRGLDKEIQLVKTRLSRLSSGVRRSYSVFVPVSASGASPLTLHLEYQVRGASWNPIYDGRLSTHDGSLKITQYGKVYQRTGEDWEGVNLTLSTTRPNSGTSLPNLSPMWVNIGGKVSAFAARTMDGGADSVSDIVLHKGKITQEKAIVESGEFIDASYKIAGNVDVPSNAQHTRVLIGDIDIESSLEVHVRPQLSSDAFLAASVKLIGDVPILPGGVKLFRDGAYVGQGRFALLRAGDDGVLFFGTDDKVVVERKVLSDVRKKAGVVLRENMLERHFVTTIKNLHSVPISVVAQETIPTSRNEKLRVELLSDITRAGYESDVDDIAGLLRWKFDLAPNADARIGLGWRLTWPKGGELSGV